ncbi:hypothetical protein G6F50_017522 [Rhizopus delemar]|uniref:Uncharacterized protein n=1 Tax=Rhizopus delemar TaxID=936053 RepID=A0A9P7C025_9FUNG|nr:hypothetical protein G6F50_017522 [Rhizopus delemar]
MARNANAARLNCLSVDGTQPSRCCPSKTSSPFLTAPRAEANSAGRNTTITPAPVHSQGYGSKVQPSAINSTRLGDTRLRRRLSRILQRASQARGGPPAVPGGRGGWPNSQPSNCQSPRIQRWRRLTSAE